MVMLFQDQERLSEKGSERFVVPMSTGVIVHVKEVPNDILRVFERAAVTRDEVQSPRRSVHDLTETLM